MLALATAWCACRPPAPADDDDVTDPPAIDPPVLPTITLQHPARGAFFDAGEPAEIAGVCEAGDAPLDTLTIGDSEVVLDGDGSFRFDYPAADGINVVSLRVTDTDGERATQAMAFHHGPTWPLGGTLPSIAVMRVSDELLDDDDPDLDDLASLVETMLEDPGTFDDLPQVATEDVVVTPTAVSLSGAEVDIVPGGGSLDVEMALHDLYAAFDLQGTGWLDWLSVGGEMWADPALASMTLALAADGGVIEASVSDVAIVFEDFEFQVDWVPGWVEELLYDTIQEYLIDELQTTAEELVAGFVQEFLETFSIEVTFGETHPVTLALEIDTLQVSPDGLTMWIDGSTSAGTSIDVPAGAGSLRTAGDPPTLPFSAAPLAVAVDDDFVNQLLATVWTSGLLEEITFDATELDAMGAGDIPPPMGPVDFVTVSFGLPMVMTGTDAADWDFDMGVGEIVSAIHRDDGVVLRFSTSLHAGARAVTHGGELTMTMEDRPAELTLAVAALEYPEALDPGDLAALVRLIVPPMLSQANEALPGFPIPSTHLGDLADVDFFQGKYLEVTDLRLGVRDGEGDEGIWVLVEGGVLVE